MMKTSKEYLVELENFDLEPIELEVKNRLKEFDEQGYPIVDSLHDLFYHWCACWIVPSLMYHGDISAFFQKYVHQINSLLSEYIDNTGCHPHQIFKHRDISDPLAHDWNNQQYLVWFGFERSAEFVAEKLNIEY